MKALENGRKGRDVDKNLVAWIVEKIHHNEDRISDWLQV